MYVQARSIGGRGATGGATPSTDFGAAERCVCRARAFESTHDDLKRLAAEFETTVGNTVALAVRALRQDRIGRQLHAPLVGDEDAWLDADLG